MRLNTSYRQIWAISAPIMLGSAVQNIIALSDGVFLYHYNEDDFAAIGIAGVFYLVVAAIGFGFSKGGQIMIARRMGEGKSEEVGRTFYALIYFEIALALLLFLFIQFGCPYLFKQIVNSEVLYTQSLAYLNYRSYGVFFSYVGVAIVALYTGIARPFFIVIDTVILAIVNIILNYALIYGYFGLPEMGISGAGLASTIAEVIAFIIFFIYILFDKKARTYRLFTLPKVDVELIKSQFNLGAPIVAQAVVGLGSWFIFFIIVENLGTRQLAITNLVRNVYLVLSIPAWGFATGINTLVSHFIGKGRRRAVLPLIWKTAKLCLGTTLILTLPICLYPSFFLYPLFGSEEMTLIEEAQPIFYVLIGILTLFSVGTIYFNGMAGTGATFYGLGMQLICALAYLTYIYIVVEWTDLGLAWAWGAEGLYWIILMGLIMWYLQSKKWYTLKI